MPRSPHMADFPADAIPVYTYAEMMRYLRKFAAGDLALVLLLGRPGIGKTEMARSALNIGSETDCIGPLYVEGHAQPFGLYHYLWLHRDQPIVLDDLDRLYAKSDCVRLLKALCNNRRTKRLSWLSHVIHNLEGVPGIIRDP